MVRCIIQAVIRRFILIATTGFSAILPLSGQPDISGSFRLNELLIESLASQDAGDDDYESHLTELEDIQKNPIDLNTCSRSDLERLPFLSDFQISSFLEYREKNGHLLSIFELQVIHGFSDDVIRMAIPYVTVKDQPVQGRLDLKGIKNGRHEAFLRFQRMLEKSRGYYTDERRADKKRYPGNPWLLNARYEFDFRNRIKAGINLEKDQGEEIFRNTNPGFDFNSAFILLNNSGVFKSAVVGDYRLAFGQGLTLWSGASPGKSSMPLNIIKRQDAVKAYSSNDENNFFRGAAASSALGRFTLTAFFSAKRRDANITDTLSAGHICFSSFQQSGYHRTSAEIADEKSVRETMAGANLVYRSRILKLGTTLVAYKLNKFLEAGEDISDIYNFSGNRLLNFGADYSVALKNFRFFGEASYGHGHMATVNGVLVNTGKYASFSILYRYFDRGYFSMHSSAFSEGSEDCNEEGFYAGIVLHPAAHLKISAYADFYRFPWLKYNRSKPSDGTDLLFQADYNPNKNIEMYLRVKYEGDPADFVPDSASLPDVTSMERSGIRYHIRYTVSGNLAMQNRVELALSHASRGLMAYHDINFFFKEIPLELDFRFAWFNTDNYDSRIYAYEQDITQGFSFSPLYDNGLRAYTMATLKITDRIKAAVRYSITYFPDKNIIGSGYDEISGHARNDLKFRLALIL